MGEAPQTPDSALDAGTESSSPSPPALERLESELGGELARFLVGALASDVRVPREKS